LFVLLAIAESVLARVESEVELSEPLPFNEPLALPLSESLLVEDDAVLLAVVSCVLLNEPVPAAAPLPENEPLAFVDDEFEAVLLFCVL
jgi:hypothetical protein